MSTLIVHSTAPYNAEPPPDRLRAAMVTPVPDFYVRSHGDVPQLDPATHRLHIGGQVATPLALSVAELQAGFPHRTIAAVMQCAGNRRADLQQVRPTSGDPWAGGAIGNAEWTGVALADLLQAAGAATGERHAAFDSADTVEQPGEGRFTFGVSIPLQKATAPEVLLAWAMNGQPLTPEHGAPLRAVVPGYAGIRSAKWLTAITVRSTPADTPIQARDYKLMPPHITAETVDWSRAAPIDAMPLNAAICEPAPFARLPPGPAIIRGYATASARAIARVDISRDGGRTWFQAALEHHPSPWSWTFWQATLDLPPGQHELAVRAWDSAGQTQPSRPDDTWNFKGYLSAAWHRVPIMVGDRPSA